MCRGRIRTGTASTRAASIRAPGSAWRQTRSTEPTGNLRLGRENGQSDHRGTGAGPFGHSLGAKEGLRRAEGRDRGQDQEEWRRQVHARHRRGRQAGRGQGRRHLRRRREENRLQEGLRPLGGSQALAAMKKRLIVCITGATGAIYGLALLRALKEVGGWESHLVLTDAGVLIVWHEHKMKRRTSSASRTSP